MEAIAKNMKDIAERRMVRTLTIHFPRNESRIAVLKKLSFTTQNSCFMFNQSIQMQTWYRNCCTQQLRFPNHHTHELRYNFITRANKGESARSKRKLRKKRIKAANSMDLSRGKRLGFFRQKNRHPIIQTNITTLDFCRFALFP